MLKELKEFVAHTWFETDFYLLAQKGEQSCYKIPTEQEDL